MSTSRGLFVMGALVAMGMGASWTRSSAPPRELILTSGNSPRANSCASCHSFEPTHSHPVGIPVHTATDLPLEHGTMTCATCHDVDTRHATGGTRVGVRTRSAASLCIQCHSGDSSNPAIMHGLAIGRAHLPSGKSVTPSGQLDRESETCMTCHDGAVATEAGSHAVRGMAFGSTGDHPIGVLLRQTERTRGGDFHIAHPSALDRRIRLFDGKLGCGSCHSVYSNERHLLAMSNLKSALCLQCHTQ